jgi:hypothetical protein
MVTCTAGPVIWSPRFGAVIATTAGEEGRKAAVATALAVGLGLGETAAAHPAATTAAASAAATVAWAA